MKKFATAFVEIYEEIAKADIVEAENQVEAMKITVLNNTCEEYYDKTLRELNKYDGNNKEEFDLILSGWGISVDAVEILT